MKFSKVLLLISFLLLHPASSSDPKPFKVLKLPTTNLSTSTIEKLGIDQNFENGILKPWVDCSEDGAQWVIENVSSSWSNELNKSHISPPPMESGTHYLWLKQYFETFGIGILSSCIFLANPGDEIRFSFWMHSSFKHFNNLQVFWSSNDTKEDQKLIELFPASNVNDYSEWRQAFVQIPVTKPTDGMIMIYGFCEPKDSAGFIAIDDISLFRKSPTSTTISLPITSPTTEVVSKNTELSLSSDTTALTAQLPLSTIFTEPEECQFGPCELCDQMDVSTYNVLCRFIPTKQLRDEYFAKFDENAYEFDWFELTPPSNDSIPFDMFASSIRFVNWFTINCDYIPNLYEVDPFAFKPNLDVANLIFKNCNFANLTFLSQLRSLRDLTFKNSSNLHDILNTFPGDLNVKILRFESCYLLELTMNDFPPLTTGLDELRIFENQKINDEIVDLFFSWALKFSRDSLIKFYIYNNGLKKIPTGLSQFNSLTYFRIDENILEPGIVKKGSLKFSDYTRLVYLRFCGINTIEAGAFSGIYEMTNVYLDGNNLTRFDSDVYQDILEQMTNYGDLQDGGFINVEGNKFDCVEDPCHLTWLLRDNRNFLPFIWDAACANGTLFEDIQLDDPMFRDCP